jgi:hypothetical protein
MLMKRSLLFINLCICLTPAFCQPGDPSKYADSITGDKLKKHLTIIASDEMEGRETGTDGQRKAAAYIEAQFKNIGLEPAETLKGYQQLYPLHRDSMTSSSVKINGDELTYGSDYFVPVLTNGSKKTTASKFVFVGYGINENEYDDYKGLDVKGKVVVFLLGEPKKQGKYVLSGTEQFSEYTFPGILLKMQIAERKGAVAAIVLNQVMPVLNDRIVSLNTRSDVYFPGRPLDKNIGYISISHPAARNIFPNWNVDSLVLLSRTSAPFSAKAVAEQKAIFNFNYHKERKITYASNVLAVLEGTDKKDEYVFLTAHYDHMGKQNDKIFYGADDDGSGTCAVLTMAETFARAKKDGNGPRRTIVFMTVSGEEKGLWGSEYYTDHPVFPLEATSVDLNTDMIGRIDTERKRADSLNYIYVVGHNKISSDLSVINEQVNKKYSGLVLDYKFDDPKDPEQIYKRSDHYNFARYGVPVLFFYDGMLQGDYHKTTDTIDKINWPLYEKRARFIFCMAWEMANRDTMLRRDIPLSEDDK